MMIAGLLHRWAPALYLLITLPTVVVLCFLTPPAMVPDESSHFLRAIQISQGGFVGEKPSSAESGGFVPYSAVEFGETLDRLIGHSEAKIDPETAKQLGEIRWHSEYAGFAAFYNTVIYMPLFYVPAAAAIIVGRSLDLTVETTFDMARIATAITSACLCALAIHFARRGRALLTVLLSLPMTLYQFASVSQDALLIATMAVTFGICSRAAGRHRPLTTTERFVVFALIGLSVATRPPYCPFVALAATSLVRSESPNGLTLAWAGRLWAPLVACAVALGWIAFGAAPVKIDFRVAEHVSQSEQIFYLLHHVSDLPALAARTVTASGIAHYLQFLGIFGWSDFYLPWYVYAGATCALVMAAVLSTGEPGGTLNRRDGLVVAACWVAAWAMVYVTLYITWTPVGASRVDGVQGRYFVPSAMALALWVPALLSRRPSWKPGAALQGICGTSHAIGWIAILLAMIANAVLTPAFVLQRFYG